MLDGNFVLMDIAAAQWAFDRLGRVDRVEIRLPAGRDVADAERLLVVAAAARPHRAAAGAARRAGRDDAAGVPLQPDRAVVRGAARRAVPGLQHRCRLGDCAAGGDRRAARGWASRGTVLRLFLAKRRRWRRWAPCSGPRRAGCSRRRRAPDVDHREHALHRGRGDGAGARSARRAAGDRAWASAWRCSPPPRRRSKRAGSRRSRRCGAPTGSRRATG